MSAQTTNRVLMIRPASFGFNPETAASNTFQKNVELPDAAPCARAESDRYVQALRQAGVAVEVVEDSAHPVKPDAVFPNNWVSFHEGGKAVLFPMASPLRRNEVRTEILADLGYEVALDLRADSDDAYLEGTGSLVLDRMSKLAYACRSHRTDERLVRTFCEFMGYEPVLFDAVERGVSIYHTNVIMAVGAHIAVVCFEACQPASLVRNKLETSGMKVLEITREQMGSFAGNMLQLRAQNGASIWTMSDQAWAALNADQRSLLAAEGPVVTSNIETIETLGGGSARCMIAELF